MAKAKRSTAPRGARQQSKAEEKQNLALYRRLRTERSAPLPKGFAGKIEADLSGSGHHAVARRMALALLEMPGSELIAKAKSDREFAVSMVHVGDVIDGSIQAYKQVLEWLEMASIRILFATAARSDMDEVVAAGKAMSEGAEVTNG